MPFPVNNDGGLAPARLDQEYSRRQAERSARSEREREAAGDAAQVGTRSQAAGAPDAGSRIETPERAVEAAEAARRLIREQPALAAAAHGQGSPQATLAALRG